MRHLIAVALSMLFISPAYVSANPADCTTDYLNIVGKNKDTVFRYTFRDDLAIKVSGPCATKINTELEKTDLSKAIILSLDSVKMPQLNVSITQSGLANEFTVLFTLDRNPNEEKNRLAWDNLLRKQSDFLMTFPVALIVGNEAGRLVSSKTDFQFYVAEDTHMWVTLVVGLVVFFIIFYGFIKNPTALRDSKNGYYSLGKSQMAFWGLLVVLTFVGIWILTGTMERIPDQVLILLGISGITGLSAIVIGENKKSVANSNRDINLGKLREEFKNLEVEKQSSPGGKLPQVSEDRLVEVKRKIEVLTKTATFEEPKFWADICDDGDGMSFHRLQVVIWTIVLGVVFLSTVFQVISMPEFSETLLILLGISNGTYLGFKIPEKIES